MSSDGCSYQGTGMNPVPTAQAKPQPGLPQDPVSEQGSSHVPCSPLTGSATQTQLITAHPKGSAASLDLNMGTEIEALLCMPQEA